MKKKINFKEKILIAGSSGMAGSAILKAFKRKGYGEPKHKGELLIPKRSELDLLDESAVHNW